MNQIRFDLYKLSEELGATNWKYYVLCYYNNKMYSYDMFDSFSELNVDMQHDKGYTLDVKDLQDHKFIKSYGSIEEIIEDCPESFI